MVGRCINPHCDWQWNVFGAGALYVLEKRETSTIHAYTEYFWLCASCDASFIVQTDASGNLVVLSRQKAAIFEKSAATDFPHLVFRSKSVPLRIDDGILRHGMLSNSSTALRFLEPAALEPSNRSDSRHLSKSKNNCSSRSVSDHDFEIK